MAIVKWEPFKEITSLQERMTRLFEESLLAKIKSGELGKFPHGTWTPAIDVYEIKDEVVIEAEVPGIKQEDIEIEIRENILILKGERPFEKKGITEENYYCIERAYGHFVRVFNLPSLVNQEKIVATLNEGVLQIRLPKQDKKKPRPIKIQTT